MQDQIHRVLIGKNQLNLEKAKMVILAVVKPMGATEIFLLHNHGPFR